MTHLIVAIESQIETWADDNSLILIVYIYQVSGTIKSWKLANIKQENYLCSQLCFSFIKPRRQNGVGLRQSDDTLNQLKYEYANHFTTFTFLFESEQPDPYQ